MKSIALPPNVIYACLAETIVLTLEGRFEVFTIGRDTEWEKVKEIYKLGIKHGMKLAAISGVNGVFTDEDIAKVVTLAKKARLTWKGGSAAKPAGKPRAAKAAAPAEAVTAPAPKAAKKAPAKTATKTAAKAPAKTAAKTALKTASKTASKTAPRKAPARKTAAAA
jgi:hypothetical protein